MPFLSYARSIGRCRVGSVGAPLAIIPDPVELTIPQLVVAQLLLGVFRDESPLAEMNWRVSSLLAVCGAPPPEVVPSRFVVGSRARGGPPSKPDLRLNPTVAAFDMTERGQLGYHLGTAVGVALIAYLNPANARWFPMHLTRAEANGGHFAVGRKRPDVVAFAISAQQRKTTLTHFVVWENKGHLKKGPKNGVKKALQQARSLKSMDRLPGIVGTTVKARSIAPRAPEAAIASQVDMPGKYFRVTTGDPEGGGGPPIDLSDAAGDNFFAGWYAPFLQVLDNPFLQETRNTLTYDGRAFVTVELMPGLRMGLDDHIYKALTARGPEGSIAAAVADIVSLDYSNTDSVEQVVHGSGLYVSVPTAYRTRNAPESAPLPPAPRPGGAPDSVAGRSRETRRARVFLDDDPFPAPPSPIGETFVHESAASPNDATVTSNETALEEPTANSQADEALWRVKEKEEEKKERVAVHIPLLRG